MCSEIIGKINIMSACPFLNFDVRFIILNQNLGLFAYFLGGFHQKLKSPSLMFEFQAKLRVLPLHPMHPMHVSVIMCSIPIPTPSGNKGENLLG